LFEALAKPKYPTGETAALESSGQSFDALSFGEVLPVDAEAEA